MSPARLKMPTTLVTLALCTVVATASGSFYYSAFTVFLVVVASLLRYVAERDRAALLGGGAVVAAITVVSLVQLAPTIVYHLRHGGNDEDRSGWTNWKICSGRPRSFSRCTPRSLSAAPPPHARPRAPRCSPASQARPARPRAPRTLPPTPAGLP